MIIQTENNTLINNVTGEDIEDQLRKLCETNNQFMILSRDEDSFMQVVILNEDQFHVEVCEKDDDFPLEYIGNNNFQTTLELFKSFLLEKYKWEKGDMWQKIEST